MIRALLPAGMTMTKQPIEVLDSDSEIRAAHALIAPFLAGRPMLAALAVLSCVISTVEASGGDHVDLFLTALCVPNGEARKAISAAIRSCSGKE